MQKWLWNTKRHTNNKISPILWIGRQSILPKVKKEAKNPEDYNSWYHENHYHHLTLHRALQLTKLFLV